MSRRRSIISTIALAAFATVATAQEAGVELQLDSRTLELGEAIDTQLVCTNMGKPDMPQAVVPDGLDLKLTNSIPMSSSFTQIINGRMSQRTTFTYPMRLTAMKEGTYTLGPITVTADGETYSTEPIQIVVRESETPTGARGDRLVFAELEVEPRSLYVTQSYTARLTMGIRKVEIGGRIIGIDLLRDVLDQRGSQLSIFVGGNVQRSDSILTDSDGERHRYEVFNVTREVRAQEVGEALVGPIFVRINYPTAVRRGFFGGSEVTQVRKDTARADAIAVEVEAPPEEGRPADYTGAIGQFKMRVTAKPKHVEKGQPVTLTIAIQGTPLEGVAGPDLILQPELASRFDYTNDELVGDVESGAKVFRRAVFPKQVGEQTIPSISWSFFDPDQERYTTLTSDPVDITVDPPSATSTTVVVPERTDDLPKGTTLTVLTGGISPNFIDPEIVLADQSFALTPPWITCLVVSPLAWLTVTLVTKHRARLKADVGFARRRRAEREAEARIKRALTAAEPALQLQGLAGAMTGYLADRFGLPRGTLTPGDVRSLLASNGVDGGVAATIVEFLETCDTARYAPGSSGALSPLQTAATVRDWIRHIERGAH